MYLSSNKNDNNSEILLGDINPLLSGFNQSAFFDLTSDIYWQVACPKRSFNGNGFTPSSNDIIFDTGIPYILMSKGI